MKTKLHIYKVVALHLSFTKAAEQLYISQPAVSKTIKNLEDTFKSNFFIRKRNSIALTDDGAAFLLYVNQILSLYSEMENQFLNKKDTVPLQLQFGVSTTVANYITPLVIARIRKQFPHIQFAINSGNSQYISNLILKEEINFGIIEGKHSDPQLHFKKYLKDEIVLVTNVRNMALKSNTVTSLQLQQLQLVERELGSGTKDIVYDILNTHNITKLNIIVRLNTNEAIKNYLYHSDSYAFLSVNAVTDDLIHNKLKIIDIKDISMERWFYFVSRTGYQSVAMDHFEDLFRRYYNF